ACKQHLQNREASLPSARLKTCVRLSNLHELFSHLHSRPRGLVRSLPQFGLAHGCHCDCAATLLRLAYVTERQEIWRCRATPRKIHGPAIIEGNLPREILQRRESGG